MTGVLAVLYENEAGWKYLRQGLELAAFDDDGRYLMYFADQYNERGRGGTYGQLQFSFPAIRCLDSQDVSVAKAEREGAEEAKRAPTLGPFAGADLVCPLWSGEVEEAVHLLVGGVGEQRLSGRAGVEGASGMGAGHVGQAG